MGVLNIYEMDTFLYLKIQILKHGKRIGQRYRTKVFAIGFIEILSLCAFSLSVTPQEYLCLKSIKGGYM